MVEPKLKPLDAGPITIVQIETIEHTVTHTRTSVSVSTKTEYASPTSTLDPTKLAFMVETRPLPHLPLQLTHMTSVIPQEWTFKFMGSNTSINYLLGFHHLRDLVASNKLTLVPLPSHWDVSSREFISQMFTDPELYRSLSPAEHLLVFQPDSIFCTKAPTTLNDFIKYDYIGAPWSTYSTYGGNGGLSLRRVSSILRLLEKERRKPGDGALEDLWLSNGLNKLEGTKMANAAVSKTFSVESVWDEAPLGYHIGWLGVHHEQVSHFLIFSSTLLPLVNTSCFLCPTFIVDFILVMPIALFSFLSIQLVLLPKPRITQETNNNPYLTDLG